MKPFSVYIHIPYCARKCPYCDFNTYAVKEIPEEEYVKALIAELDHYSSQEVWAGRPVQTIYFGGGTPSLFESSSIRKLIATIRQRFSIIHGAEITIEANPGLLPGNKLDGFSRAGVNRLSLGSQSFSEKTLKTLGRTHHTEDITISVEEARNAGIANISLDIIYGVPNQTVDQLKFDLEAACRLEPTHISSYGLTIEKGTPFYSAYKKGDLKLLEHDLVADMMSEMCSFLSDRGFERYEISNFAAKGLYARHNTAYWNGDDYLGLGAGAHSYCRSLGNYGTRWTTYAAPEKYMSTAFKKGSAESWKEELSQKEAVFEYFFLGLRKIAGVSLSEFQNKFKASLKDYYGHLIDILLDQKTIVIEDDMLRLSDKGLMLADNVIGNFSDPEIPDIVMNG